MFGTWYLWFYYIFDCYNPAFVGKRNQLYLEKQSYLFPGIWINYTTKRYKGRAVCLLSIETKPKRKRKTSLSNYYLITKITEKQHPKPSASNKSISKLMYAKSANQLSLAQSPGSKQNPVRTCTNIHNNSRV